MSKSRTEVSIPSLKEVGRGSGSIGRQLAQGLREAIASGELKPGERVPSTRALATSLGFARGTVVGAFDQLVAEGYLDAQVGAGTRVASAFDNQGFEPTPRGARAMECCCPLPPTVERLAAVASALAPQPLVPFAIAVPAEGVGPDDNWRKLGNRVRASRQGAPAGYSDPAGEPKLRAVIADHVRRTRAVLCEPENVIVTSGTQQGLYMACRVLLTPGCCVWAEDPAYHGLTAVLDDLGVRTCRVPIDKQGIDVGRGVEACPEARAAFVTPSHQYPVGMPLSMARRQALVAWAERQGAWIVENDYDSDLRYAGHPFPAMQGLSPSRVVYLGTFSKVLFPSLRLGYVIAPTPLARAFAGARAILDRHSPTADQHVLAAYIREGFFEGHIRRIRALYADRRAVLLDALNAALPPGCSVQPSDQGMHVLMWLPRGADDMKVAAEAMNSGIAVRPISQMYSDQPGKAGLMLGFGGFSSDQLRESVARFTELIRRVVVQVR